MQQSARSSLAGAMGQQDWLAGAGTQQQQQQQLGYGQSEHAHMLTAIRQPLFIQTPLQVMLETLVEKLQLQAGVISGMQDRLEALERNKLTGAELLFRIQLLEGRVDAATAVTGTAADTPSTATAADATCASNGGSSGGGVGVSPFAQAKLMKQVAVLEQQVSVLQTSSTQLTFNTDQVLLPHLQQCEQRLAGVTNLAGSLIAVDLMAAELGITVPHPPLSTLTHDSTSISSSGSSGSSGNSGSRNSTEQAVSAAAMPQQQQQQQQQGQGGVLTLSRQQQLQQQINGGKEQMAAVQQHLQQLQQQVNKLCSDVSSGHDQQLGVCAGLQDSLSGLADSLTQQVALIRREFKPALQATELHQLSMTEFTKLQRQVEVMEAKHTALNKDLNTLKAKDFAELSASVAQLSRRVARVTGSPGALSDTDKALAAAQAELRAQLEALAARFASHEAAELAGKGIASQQELQELSVLMRGKASQDDMRTVVNRAVDLALQAHRDTVGDSSGSDTAAASRSRCLVCDRSLRDSSSSPPRCSTAPQQQQQPNYELLLPVFDAFRPVTAAAAAAAGCSNSSGVACGGASGNTSGRTGSPARQQGASSGTSGGPVLGPLGPGLHAAQLRQMSAQKAGRLQAAAGGCSSSRPDSSSSISNAAAAAAAAAGAGGILGLMPVGYSTGGGEGVPAVGQGDSSSGLLVADLVSSNLRLGGGGAAAASAAAAGGGGAFHEDVSLNGSSQGIQQQQQLAGGLIPAASGSSHRPQTAAPNGGREAGVAAMRPQTAAAAAGGGRPGSSSPLGKGVAAGKRTPVFI